MSENYETEYLPAQVMFQAQEAVKPYYLKITPYKAKSHVLTWVLQKQMATLLVIKIILLTYQAFISKYIHLNYVILSSDHSYEGHRDRAMMLYGALSREVWTQTLNLSSPSRDRMTHWAPC